MLDAAMDRGRRGLTCRAFSQGLSLWDEIEWIARTSYLTRAGGNFAQPNHAGLLFVMGIAAGSTLAAFVLALCEKQDAVAALRSGIAAGAANALLPGAAQFTRESFNRLLADLHRQPVERV